MLKKTSKRKMILDIFFALLFTSAGLWHFFTAPMSRGDILFLGITFGFVWALLWAIHEIRKVGLDTPDKPPPKDLRGEKSCTKKNSRSSLERS